MIVHHIPLDAAGVLDPVAWRAGLVAARARGMRMVTMFAHRRNDRTAIITAVMQADDRTLHVSRTELDPAIGYPNLTREWPALHCFEREMHEQTGLQFDDHPWLKPIRFPTGGMDHYPFYVLAGKSVHEVAVGPIHAGVIEPGSFRFSCAGEHVHHLEIHLGYQHRGVEALLRTRPPGALVPLVETIAGDTSVAHTWAHVAALEALARTEVTADVDLSRAIALELERVAMHLAGLAGLSADVGFLQGATTYGRLRTTAINATMRLCGNRFGRGAVRLQASGMQLAPASATELLANLALLQRDLEPIDDCFSTARSVLHRLRTTGILGTATALELGVVGMAARASGIAIDARTAAPAGVFHARPIAARVLADGDCWARAKLRIDELGTSLAWLVAAVPREATWTPARTALGALAPDQLAIAIVEGWRGEVVHCIETGASGELVHYKVQDPSLRNWMGLAIAVRGNEISDFPICNKSFDLSYCGNDL